jgi:hypothetical protein
VQHATICSIVTDDLLILEARRLASDLKTRTGMWAHFFRVNTPENARLMLEFDAAARRDGRATGNPDPDLPPPATQAQLRMAREQLGFAFPALLERMWTEIANGGFGPGYGIVGLEGGAAFDPQGWNVVENYLSLAGSHWPARLVPICDWGCMNLTATDCGTPEGEMVDLIEGDPRDARRRELTFPQWMEAWIQGVDLWIWGDGQEEDEEEDV